MSGYNGPPGWYVPNTDPQPPAQSIHPNTAFVPLDQPLSPTFNPYNTYYIRMYEQNRQSRPDMSEVWTTRAEPQHLMPTPTYAYGYPNVSNDVHRNQVRQPTPSAQHYHQPTTNYTWNTGPSSSGVSYDLPGGTFPAAGIPVPQLRRHGHMSSEVPPLILVTPLEFVSNPEYHNINRGYYQEPNTAYGAGGYPLQPPVHTHGGNVWNIGPSPTTSNVKIPIHTPHQNIYGFGQLNSSFPSTNYPVQTPIRSSNAATFQPKVVVTSVPVQVPINDTWNTNCGRNVSQAHQPDSGKMFNLPSNHAQPTPDLSGFGLQQQPIKTPEFYACAMNPRKMTTLREDPGCSFSTTDNIPKSSQSKIRTEDWMGDNNEPKVTILKGPCGRTIGTIDKATNKFQPNLDIDGNSFSLAKLYRLSHDEHDVHGDLGNYKSYDDGQIGQKLQIWSPIPKPEPPRKPMNINPTFATNMEAEPAAPIVKPCMWSFLYRYPQDKNMETAPAPDDICDELDKAYHLPAHSTPIQSPQKTPADNVTPLEKHTQTYAEVATKKVTPVASVMPPEKKPALTQDLDMLGPRPIGRQGVSAMNVDEFPALLDGRGNATKGTQTCEAAAGGNEGIWSAGIGEWCKEKTPRKEENQELKDVAEKRKQMDKDVPSTPAAVLLYNVPHFTRMHELFKMLKHYGAMYKISTFTNKHNATVFGVFFEREYAAKRVTTGLDGHFVCGHKVDIDLVAASNKDTLDYKVKTIRKLKEQHSIYYKLRGF